MKHIYRFILGLVFTTICVSIGGLICHFGLSETVALTIFVACALLLVYFIGMAVDELTELYYPEEE